MHDRQVELFQALSVVVDYYYYRKWTSSVLNLLVYNVLGGGESHLYGTEGPLYYLQNGFNNFNFCFLLALLFLAVLPVTKNKYAPDLLVIVSPVYIWIAFMSLQPHKEERFVYWVLLYNVDPSRELFLFLIFFPPSISCKVPFRCLCFDFYMLNHLLFLLRLFTQKYFLDLLLYITKIIVDS